LGRFAEAARQFKADEIVRITADDPLKDPEVIERVVRTYLNSKTQYDYVSNNHHPTFPEGLDVEVFSKEALFCAER
jgi:spore coat polysaccharide biosynthesis protein SpsF (cytidylyltransferase family)|tara:strand:+ start:432 stop:659 length:228 start_codon:yes stop_codon:yes gene_type:complete